MVDVDMERVVVDRISKVIKQNRFIAIVEYLVGVLCFVALFLSNNIFLVVFFFCSGITGVSIGSAIDDKTDIMELKLLVISDYYKKQKLEKVFYK